MSLLECRSATKEKGALGRLGQTGYAHLIFGTTCRNLRVHFSLFSFFTVSLRLTYHFSLPPFYPDSPFLSYFVDRAYVPEVMTE